VWYNFSGIDDYEIFPSRILHASSSPFYFKNYPDPARIPHTIDFGSNKKIPIESLLSTSESVAFLIIKNDTLIFERYYQGYTDTSLSLSFSMAKSFLSVLIGCAIDDGLIGSVEQPVTDFVPELEKNGFGKVKIKHLLQMTSGMDYIESDNPFGMHPYYYYSSNLEDNLLELDLAEKPGQRFEYKSGENQLLGLILSRALETRTITEYMQEKIWDTLGMEYNGRYIVDREDNGLEKTFCCIAARARDFAKFGRLYLNKGNWNGKQIVSQNWVEQSTKIDTTEGSVWNYQYQWWLVNRYTGDYMAAGHLGQYVYVNPGAQLIIVRLGKDRGKMTADYWKEIFTFLSDNI
jgi:CubicO group peptidase (beta-lactamase class C family)